MLFIRPARRKRNLIYDKFYQNMPKVFLYTKSNTMICETITKMEIFNSNGQVYNIYPNLLKIPFIHKMSKNKAHTWNEHFQVPKVEICNFNFNFKISKFEISKIGKIKIHIFENLVNGWFCFLNPQSWLYMYWRSERLNFLLLCNVELGVKRTIRI